MTHSQEAGPVVVPPPSQATGAPSSDEEARRQIAQLRQIGLDYGLLPPVEPQGVEPLERLQPRPRARLAKRVLDLGLGTVLALLALPVILVAALATAISLRTQPFFLQRRVGELGRDFMILKIRTLPKSVPAYGNKMDLGVDAMRLPFVARLLRNCHLDELPQLLLVPLGHMSLVGPRPCQPMSVEPMPPAVELMRTAVPQGCTGVWQISEDSAGLASGSPDLDEFYLRHGCIRLDLWIMARTVGYVLGIVKGIKTEDIPRWVRGRGLIVGAAAVPRQEQEEMRTIVLPPDPITPPPLRLDAGLATAYNAEVVAD